MTKWVAAIGRRLKSLNLVQSTHFLSPEDLSLRVLVELGSRTTGCVVDKRQVMDNPV